MRAAIVENGVVVNVIAVDSAEAMLEYIPGLVEAPTANIGDLWDGEKFTSPAVEPPPPPAPADAIPMLNIKLVLAEDGKLAAAEGIINGMEGEEGAMARAYWMNAATARRDNYLVQQLWPVLYEGDEAAFDAAWLRAAALNP